MVVPYLKKIDLVLLMSVNPGFAGQEFIDISDKIKELREQYKGDIEVDGGITDETAKIVHGAGATILVSGSHIFKSANSSQTIKQLRSSLS
jgi:ribulose-phosphate 3-epimerase